MTASPECVDMQHFESKIHLNETSLAFSAIACSGIPSLAGSIIKFSNTEVYVVRARQVKNLVQSWVNR